MGALWVVNSGPYPLVKYNVMYGNVWYCMVIYIIYAIVVKITRCVISRLQVCRVALTAGKRKGAMRYTLRLFLTLCVIE